MTEPSPQLQTRVADLRRQIADIEARQLGLTEAKKRRLETLNRLLSELALRGEPTGARALDE